MAQTLYVTQVQLDWDDDEVNGDDYVGADDGEVGGYDVHGYKEDTGGYKDDNE